jgi:hypothetical protein
LSSVLSDGSGNPGRLVAEHGVEDDEEFSHAGGEDDFEGFAMLSEAISEGFDDGVAAAGGQSSHVEYGADGFTPATDGAFALVFSAVAIERSQSDQGGYLLAIELTEFGDIGQECGGSDAPQPWDGLHELGLVAPVVIRFDEDFDGGFDFADLPFQEFEDGLDAFPDGLSVGDLEPVRLHRAEVDELSPPSDELLDFGLFFGGFLGRLGLHLLGEEGQDAGIQAVGLGDQAEGPGKVPDPAGIDDRDVITGVEEVGDELSLVAARGFQDKAAIRGRGQQLLELLVSRGVIGQGVSLTGGEKVEIERGLGNVDPDPRQIRAIHGDVPFLPMRARAAFGAASAPATVRADFQRPATILLCDGVLSAEARTIYRRPFRGWLRSQPRSREH